MSKSFDKLNITNLLALVVLQTDQMETCHAEAFLSAVDWTLYRCPDIATMDEYCSPVFLDAHNPVHKPLPILVGAISLPIDIGCRLCTLAYTCDVRAALHTSLQCFLSDSSCQPYQFGDSTGCYRRMRILRLLRSTKNILTEYVC